MVDSDGRIAAVGPDHAVPHPPGTRALAFPTALVLPGFVNLHTHLELHALRGSVVASDFSAWIQQMRRIRDTASADTYAASAEAGLREAWRYGTTTVVDTGVSGATVAALKRGRGRGLFFQEAIGPDPAQAARLLSELAETIAARRSAASPRVRIGLSPHAPYTVSPELLTGCVALARREQLPLAMHLAESVAESQFVTRGEGPFAAAWRERGLPLPPSAASPIAYADRAGLLRPGTLVIHAVQVDDSDVLRLHDTGAAVVACPRSNRYHGHGDPSLGALDRAKVRWGLGTDSGVSVDTLDLLAEARLARAIGGMSAADAVRCITIEAARGLAWEAEIGSLEPGKWADLVVLELEAPSPEPEVLADRVLSRGGEAMIATFVEGREVWSPDDGSLGAAPQTAE